MTHEVESLEKCPAGHTEHAALSRDEYHPTKHRSHPRPRVENVPAGHAVQVSEPRSAVFPSGQGMHSLKAVAPRAGKNVSRGQGEQLGEPAAAKVPGPHTLQTAALVAPTAEEARPGAQGTQDASSEPTAPSHVPAGHEVQVVEPATAYVPLPQAMHARAKDAWPERAPKKPGGQGSHAAAPAAAAKVPAAHWLQAGARAGDQEPALHGAHAALLSAPLPADAVPGGQGAHAEAAAAPEAAKKVPPGHNTQAVAPAAEA